MAIGMRVPAGHQLLHAGHCVAARNEDMPEMTQEASHQTH
jgi:hypothetical protein